MPVHPLLLGLWQQLTSRPDFWGFVSIPFVAAVVTWVHVWFAMKMVFYPLEFRGLAAPWLGWQGIVPRKSGKMAGIVVDNTMSKVASLAEIFHEMEPALIARQIASGLAARVEEFMEAVLDEEQRALWAKLPPPMKQPILDQVRARLPVLVEGMLKELADKIEDHLDLRKMVVDRLTRDKALIVKVFHEVGSRELKFIVNSSFVIGLFFGTIQMALWYFLPYSWGLPVYGACLGYLTNWVALNMVFRPLEPVHLGPFRFQGLFLRRQAEVSERFAALTTAELLTVKTIMSEVMTGERAALTREVMRRHLAPLLQEGLVGMALRSMLKPDAQAALVERVVDQAVAQGLTPLDDPEFNRDRSLAVARIFSTRMSAMTPAEFQDVLRPAFHEDEWIIIALGAIFGFLAGWAQLVVGFR
jgi:uncharacterized membrane protein YheB (UPF0754 family)